MKIKITRLGNLPRLAWSLCWRRGESTIDASVGPQVEASERHLVSGVWSGPYEEYAFDEAENFFGTGVKVATNGLILAAPTHTLAPIYVYRRRSRVVAANSLPYLLSLIGDRLDPKYPFYDADLMSSIFGLKMYRRQIPTANGDSIDIRYACNLILDGRGNIREQAKRKPPAFVSYGDYVSYIRSELEAVYSNATASARQHVYGLITTLSSGYDSPAAAVLARELGCRTAVTFDKARAAPGEDEDSGRAIGDVLAMDVIEYHSRAFKDDAHAHQVSGFFSSGYGGGDLPFVSAGAALRGNLVFTGYHGDAMWDPYATEVGPDIVRKDPSGSSMLEFSLCEGFLSLPIPFIGVARQADVVRISNDESLLPWRVGGRYDRPIPRRIAESAGVPRELFGQKKLAINRPYQTTGLDNPELTDLIPAPKYAEFRQFIQEQVPSFEHFNRRWAIKRRFFASYKGNALLKKLGLEAVSKINCWTFRKPITRHNFVVHWACEDLVRQYLASRD